MATALDPKLQDALEAASKAGQTIQAVVFLDGGAAAPPPEETEAAVAALIADVERATAEKAVAVNVFRNLHSFAVEASPRFVRALVDRAEVRSVRANRSPR